jgi:phosphatidylinositol alpha-1,6-mannosyltransferase
MESPLTQSVVPQAASPQAFRHAFVTQDYGPDLGGIARRNVELCRRLTGGVVVSTVAHRDAAVFDAGESYPIARQPFDITDAKRFGNQIAWARTLPVAGVLHVGNIRPAGYPVWWAHHRAGLPYIIYVYGMDLLKERRKFGGVQGALKRYTARRLFADAAGVVAISAWTAELTADIMRRAGITHAPPVATIELGTDPGFFRPDRDTGALRRRLGLGSSPLLLTVARLVPHKGQDIAIEALARLPGDVRYLIIGEGPDAPRLRALAASLGVADRVTLAGALDDAEIAEAYAAASVYVGLSRRDGDVSVEGFGISFVEAGASGTPSVAGDSGGVRAAVRDGETGIIVPPSDPGAAAEAIRALLDDAARRAAMGVAARRAVESHYNWDRVASETAAFVASVTG